ncbi:MAG: hypothetical protein NTU65_10395, partial [Cyanobacteria bacterium]|nr:hypothetical protein [Cyanobacteriota bacterium]
MAEGLVGKKMDQHRTAATKANCPHPCQPRRTPLNDGFAALHAKSATPVTANEAFGAKIQKGGTQIRTG